MEGEEVKKGEGATCSFGGKRGRADLAAAREGGRRKHSSEQGGPLGFALAGER